MPRVRFDKDSAFSSERLMFRGIKPEDAEELVRWRSLRDIYEVSGQARPVTMEEHIVWFNGYACRSHELRVIITEKESGEDIGMVGGIFEGDAVILSYYIGEREFRGRGYAQEAVAAFMEYVKTFGISKFVARIKPSNAASIACVKKLGFMETCRTSVYEVYCLIESERGRNGK